MSKRIQERKTGEELAVAIPIHVFGVKKRLERKANFFLRFGCFTRPGESRVGSEFCFRDHRETCARREQQPSNEFSRVAKKDDNPSLVNTRKLVQSGV